MELKRMENQRLREETRNWASKYEALKNFALENKISIPPELGSD